MPQRNYHLKKNFMARNKFSSKWEAYRQNSWREEGVLQVKKFGYVFSSDSIPKADPSKTDLPPGEYGDRHEVASNAKASNEEGGGQRDVGEPREDCHSRVLV